MFDFHIHSSFSADSTVDMEEMCIAAKEKGLREICFTEHMDIDYPDDDIIPVDLNAYDLKIKEVRRKIPQLLIRKGIEAGFQQHVQKATDLCLTSQKLDFVINSVHVIDGMEVFFPPFYTDKTQKEAYTRYLEVVLQSVTQCTCYNVIGHLGYVVKGAPYTEKELQYLDYNDLIDAILKKVIETGHGIEVNTSGYKTSSSPIPHSSIIRRYRELGGEILTIGSDAHSPQYLAYQFDPAKEIIRQAGFRYQTTFCGMKPEFHKL